MNGYQRTNGTVMRVLRLGITSITGILTCLTGQDSFQTVTEFAHI